MGKFDIEIRVENGRKFVIDGEDKNIPGYLRSYLSIAADADCYTTQAGEQGLNFSFTMPYKDGPKEFHYNSDEVYREVAMEILAG